MTPREEKGGVGGSTTADAFRKEKREARKYLGSIAQGKADGKMSRVGNTPGRTITTSRTMAGKENGEGRSSNTLEAYGLRFGALISPPSVPNGRGL